MVTKHLANFYTYKSVTTASVFDRALSTGKTVKTDNASPLEHQVQECLVRANELFFEGRFQPALDQYLLTYNVIHRFLHPDAPVFPAALIATRLRSIAVFDTLLAAANEVSRYRHIAGSNPIIAPVDPPAELLKCIDQLGAIGTVDPLPPATKYYRQAVGYLKVGAVGQARAFLERAKAANNGKDHVLEAHVAAASGAAALQGEEPERAQKLLNDAQARYEELRLAGDAASAANNIGVLHTLNGDHKSAGAAFAAAGDAVPLGLGRTLEQPLNPGAASAMARPMGRDGLGLILRDVDSPESWVAIPATVAPSIGAERLGVFLGDRVVDVDLIGNPVKDLKAKVYDPRLVATTLRELHTFESLPGNFTAYLAHIRDFTLPLAIGDCHFELGEFEAALGWYEKARDYPYLNQLIEAPLIWVKIAKTYLGWGNFLYERGDKVTATTRYEEIMHLAAPQLDAASPLYASPVFDAMRAAVAAILAAPEPLDADVHNPAIAEVVLLAKLNLQNIAAGIDFPLLSVAQEQVPVFTFEYLQNVARYFADHTIQAERTYITFKTSAEQEEFQRSMLENAVALEEANEQLERKKVEIANEQKAAVDANEAYARLQARNARDLRTEYGNVSLQEAALDVEITYVGAPTTKYDFSGYEGYGIANGSHRADEVLRTLTQRRRELSRGIELSNMDRHIGELDAAVSVAQRQQAIARAQVQAAQIQRQIATLRREQAEQQLDLFESEEFTPDLWNRLANEIKAVSRAYLQQAIAIAKLMEQAYEFEIGESVSVIKSNYTRNDLSGLLAGDFLLRDIDSFTFLRIIAGQKKQPMKEIISLADRYPLQFLRSFQRTGRMEFRTDLGDFDLNYPGGYQQRIKRVEVVVEGLIGHGGTHGTLTNTGVCLTRMRNGGVKMRLLKPETLLLSSYRLAGDSIVFSPDREMLAIFENSPIATSWILDLRPSVNDLIYNFISDVKLLIYYESFYDSDLVQPVLEELAETQPRSGRRTVALRYELFDEFFAFQDTGEVRFTLRDTMLPFFHRNPRIDDLSILIETDDGVSPAGLVVTTTSADGTMATQATDTDGAIAMGTGTALNAFAGKPLLQEWTIAVPQAANSARFTAGFEWSQVRNIILVAEYDFEPLRITGEPYVLLRDQFETDPLAAFDVVDDVGAATGAPSNWQYDAAAKRLVERSGIFGDPTSTVPNGPAKPGTYLVRKQDATLPALKDFLVIAHVSAPAPAAGIGFVFRWQDADNFYFFLMDGQRGYRRLGKKIGGTFQELATVAADLAHGYVADHTMIVKVRAQGDDLRVFIDGSLVLSGRDTSLPTAGRVGFYAWGNAGARFDDLQVVEI